MTNFLFASIAVTAHTANPLPIAARLVERGHQVTWYAGRAFHDRIAAVGAHPVGYDAADDFSGLDLEEHFPQLKGSGPKIIARAFADVFVGHAPQRVADLRAVLAERPAAVLLSDALLFGAGLTCELAARDGSDGPVWATFGDGPVDFPDPDAPPFGPGLLPMPGPIGRLRNRIVQLAADKLIFRAADRRYAEIRRDLGLPATTGGALEASCSPNLHLQASVPSFEYPRRNLPAHVHWIGALRPDPVPGWTPPAWWPEVTGATRPVVHVTQGSLRPDMTELVVPALRALADRDVLVVVTSGAASESDVIRAFGGPLPANVRVARFLPYDEILKRASVFVTNGGWSGLTLALHHGVPIVQAGTTEEKAENGARVQWSGVGLRLKTSRPSASALGLAVGRVLAEPSFRAAAGRVQSEMAEHDAAEESADLLLQLAAVRGPVTRAQSAAT
jgi:UDP:flavonoid glycosyltransferase YjiC (YdhE family)